MTSAVCGKPPRAALYRKLKPGPGRPPDEVLANQRARLCGAMVELVADGGYERVTVRGLAQVAGVSTKTFYKCFANVEECFVVTYTRIIRDTLRCACELPSDGEDPLCARTRATFESLAQDRKAAQLILIDFYSAGPKAATVARSAGRTFAHLIREEFAAPPRSVRVPAPAAQGVFGAALRVARSRLLGQAAADPTEVAAGFTDWLLAVRDDRVPHLLRNGVKGGQQRQFRLPPPTPAIGDERQFLLAAAARLGTSRGYRNLSVTAIRNEAGVTRRSFDANFANVADCFLSAVESRLEGAVARARRKARNGDCWEARVVRAIACLCAEVSMDPELARLGFMDILAPGRAGVEMRESLITRWAERLCRSAPARCDYTALAAEASLAASWGIARGEVVTNRAERIAKLAPLVAFIVLAPAIGPESAERVIVDELRLEGPAEDRRHRARVS